MTYDTSPESTLSSVQLPELELSTATPQGHDGERERELVDLVAKVPITVERTLNIATITKTHQGVIFEHVPSSDKEIHPDASKTASTSSLGGATFNFVNSIVGAGIIGIPFAINRTGFVFGILCLCIVSYLVDYGVRTLIRLGLQVKQNTYESLCRHVFGKKGFYAVSLFMFIFAYGGMVAYIIIIGDTVPKIAAQSHVEFFANREVVIVVFATVCILPLCLLREMSSLAWSSCLSVLADVLVVIIVLYAAPEAAFQQGIEVENELTPYTFAKPRTLFAGLGTMSFAFTCHHSSFFIQNSMHNPTKSRWNLVTHLSIFISFACCLVLGLAGYLNFFSTVKGDILNNFHAHDPVINVARGLLALTMVFTYPMEQYVARHSLHAMLFQETQVMSIRRHVGITLLLWSSSVFLGLLLENVGIVLEITGAIAASMLGYIFPGMLYIGVNQSKLAGLKLAWKQSDPMYEPSLWKRIQLLIPFCLPFGMTVFGVLLMGIGTISCFL